MLAAASIFLFTLVFVIWQPRGLGIGWSACSGAVVALSCGVIQWSDIPVVWHIVWNATITFIAIILISLLLDRAGFFKWAALHVALWGGGRGRLLFALLVLLGAAISAVFTNDGAALILTPIVIAMLRALRFSHQATLACVMAAGFIADTASLPLVVSNLVNIVSANYFKIGFAQYASVMAPVNVAAVAMSLLALYAFFRKDVPVNYDVTQLAAPSTVIQDRITFVAGWWVLGLLLLGFFWLGRQGVPISAVAAVGAAILLAVAAKGREIPIREVIKDAPWQIVFFSLGMYLVVYGLRNAGLTDHLTRIFNSFATHGLWAAALGTGVLTAILSSIMNNMPTVLVGAFSIDATSAQGVVREAMVYANIIGCDLGPKITPIGSLATLLWLHVLDKKQLHISWGCYFRVGAMLTLPVLVVTLAALVIRLQ